MSTNPEFSIQAFQAGDGRAFTHVYNLYHNWLLALTTFWTTNKQAGEDIMQDTFIKLWINRKEFNGLHHIKAFLYTTARNACLDYLEHKKVIRNNEATIIQYLSGAGDISPAEKQRDEIELLALRLFAEDARPDVKFYLENDISSAEAGGLFNISPRTLRRLAQKCIDRLRQKLGLR